MRKRTDRAIKQTRDNFIRYITKIWEIIKSPEVAILPGQLAFFLILSLVPIITLCGYGAGLFNINFDTIVDLLANVIPGGVDNILPYISGNTIDFKLAIILIWMFYLASNGCNSVIVVSNQIYGINQSNFFKRRIKAIFMTLAIVFLIIFMLLVPVFGNKIIDLIATMNMGGIGEVIINIIKYAKGPVMWIIMFIFIRTLYEVAPDRVRKNSHLNTGSIFTTIGFIIVTEVYRRIASNMTTYNIFYGALSNIAVLMLWLYFISFVFVIGLSLNYGEEIEKKAMDKTGALKIVTTR